jgi:hypothetical protein
MVIDFRAKRVLFAVLILFVVTVALKINGSSIGVWKDVLRDDASPSGVIFSTPKSVRSDEWMAWTPSIFAQAFHRPPFPAENANLGAGKSPLLMSVPVRHFAMFFRPQLYGFFLFDIETAFAFYWNVKVFALFVSFFLLLRALTRNDFWISLFGAGWVSFSAYVQWWFSCPPMMPEMLASWAAAILCVIHLFRSETLVSKIVAMLILVIAGVNFTLCFYPPFQVPLIYLGVAIVAGWLWQNKNAALHWRTGGISLVLAGLAIATVLVPYILECKPTLEILAHTSYPGSRRTHGGEMTITDTFNGVLGFFNSSEKDYLASRGNSCEASNFYPLWIFALAGGGFGLWRDRRNRSVEIMVLSCLALFTLYIFCPFPTWLCQWTLFNYVTGTRALLTTGIAGVLFTTMLLAQPPRLLPASRRLIAAIAVFAGFAVLLMVSYSGNEKFLSPGRFSLLVALNVLFVTLYYFASTKMFCGVFLLCLVLNNSGINPVATGLGPLLDATPAAVVHQLRESDPDGKWISYSNAWLPQFFKAHGADVINGLHVVPDPIFCQEMDSMRRYEPVWNRYAFVVFEQADTGEKPEFRILNPFVYTLKISPLDSALLARGARYAVFPQSLDSPGKMGLRLLASFPESKIWIYQLSGVPRPKASAPD